MVLDYRERKPVTRNRPKKQPVGFFALIVTGAVAVSFAAGLFSGWLIFRPKKNVAPLSAAARTTAEQSSPAAAPAGSGAAPPIAQRGQEPPLTFYETLSKGNSNALIGTGLNPKKIAESAPEKPVTPASALTSDPKREKTASPHVAEQKKPSPTPAPAAVPDPDKKAAGADPVKDAKKTATKSVKFTVQVASYREKKEADATAARFIEKGLAAYVSELKTPDKGTWYRVRVGKHLDEKAAADLASRAGKGALPVPE